MNTAAAQYKELLAAVHQAARAQDEADRQRLVELVPEIDAAREARKAAVEAETTLTGEVDRWWRKATKPLGELPWISSGRPPQPDPSGDPAELDEYLAEVAPATTALHAALKKAGWRRR